MSRLGPDTPHLQAQIHANRMSFLAAELEVGKQSKKKKKKKKK